MLISILSVIHGEPCGLVNLNDRSIVLVAELKTEKNANISRAVVIRVIESVYGETLEGQLEVTQIDKARTCGKPLEIGDKRVFVIETRPGHKKYTLVSSLPLSLKHLAVNAKRGRCQYCQLFTVMTQGNMRHKFLKDNPTELQLA